MSGTDAILIFLVLIGMTLFMLVSPQLFERFPRFKRVSDRYGRVTWHPATALACLMLALASPFQSAKPLDWPLVLLSAFWLAGCLLMRWEESLSGPEADSRRIRSHRRW